MSISSFFAQLGAPLANVRWSWGARRPQNGAVFLRVWQDLKLMRGDATWMLILEPWMNDRKIRGHEERRQHVAAIRAGAPCYLIMCTAADVAASPRRIADFNDTEVFAGGELLDTAPGFEYPPGTPPHVRTLTAAGATWIGRGARIPVRDLG